MSNLTQMTRADKRMSNLTQMTRADASVLMELLCACDNETLYPACNNADLYQPISPSCTALNI